MESPPSFDVVVVAGPNEMACLEEQLSRVRQFVRDHQHIFVVVPSAWTQTAKVAVSAAAPGFATVIDESIFPFTFADVAKTFEIHGGKCNRNGWYLQQLLKLYAGRVIPDISEYYLVVDADVFFLRPVSFWSAAGEVKDSPAVPFFTTSSEHHRPYFDHMSRLHPDLKRSFSGSGISHHMMFSRPILDELFTLVERYHNRTEDPADPEHIPFWRIFLDTVEEHRRHPPDYSESGASEYEMYFHFVTHAHPQLYRMRQLSWHNVPWNTSDRFEEYTRQGFDYVSLCSWWTIQR